MYFGDLEHCNNKAKKVMADLTDLKEFVPDHDHYYEFYLRYAKDVMRIALGGPYRFLIYINFDELTPKNEAGKWLCNLSIDLEKRLSPELAKIGGHEFKGVVIDPFFKTGTGYTLCLAVKDYEVLSRRTDEEALALFKSASEKKWKSYFAMSKEMMLPAMLGNEVLDVKEQSDSLQKLERLCGPDANPRERVYLATREGCA